NSTDGISLENLFKHHREFRKFNIKQAEKLTELAIENNIALNMKSGELEIKKQDTFFKSFTYEKIEFKAEQHNQRDLKSVKSKEIANVIEKIENKEFSKKDILVLKDVIEKKEFNNDLLNETINENKKANELLMKQTIKQYKEKEKEILKENKEIKNKNEQILKENKQIKNKNEQIKKDLENIANKKAQELAENILWNFRYDMDKLEKEELNSLNDLFEQMEDFLFEFHDEFSKRFEAEFNKRT
ncbi:hypothetical protein, partial [Mycoplasmopsis pullorum]|uniref:hypothetical protein n=1 Tax=Mycoplasmopsis pullorum TaxID=48003 RepID=UPI0015D63411